MGGGRAVLPQCNQACVDATDVIVNGNPAIGVELAERDVQRPVAIAEMPQRIGGEVKKLADAHSGAAQQKQGIGEQIVIGSKLVLQTLVVVR